MTDPRCMTAELETILNGHGLATRRSGDHVLLLGGPGLVLRADVYPKEAAKGTRMIQLDVCLRADVLGGQTLIESCAGTGADDEAAVQHAFAKFCQASFHVLMAAFLGEECCKDQVEWDTWTEGDRTWRACLGPLILMGSCPGDLAVTRLLAELKERVLPTLESGVHWVRVYYSQLGSQTVVEALLDNDPWPDGEEVVRRWHWPRLNNWYSARLFFVLRPPEPGSAERRPTYFWHGLRALADNPHADDGEIVDLLLSWGVPEIQAQLLVGFLPIAFGRQIVSRLGRITLSDEFGVIDSDDRLHLAPLRAAPHFEQARLVAERGELSRDEFRAIALRSSEMNAANRILGDGKTLDGCRMSPPVLLGVRREDLDSFGRESGAPILSPDGGAAGSPRAPHASIPFRIHEEGSPEAPQDRPGVGAHLEATGSRGPSDRPWWKFWSK